jgi:hypothetical protein
MLCPFIFIIIGVGGCIFVIYKRGMRLGVK